MDKKQFPRRFRVYIPLLILAAVITFLLPRTPKFAYDYKKGEPWAYETLVAKFDFPILKTDLQLSRERERLASEIVPYYRQDASAGFMAQTALNEVDLGAHEYLRPHLSALLSDIYSRGVLGETKSQGDSSFVLKTISVRRDGASVRIPVDEVYTLTTARAELKKTVQDLCSKGADSVYAAAGLDNLVHQDLILDKKLTDDMYKASLDDLSTTDGLFKAHQTIIKYGDVVKAETQQLLDSYRAEYDASIGRKFILEFFDGNITRLQRFRFGAKQTKGDYEVLCFPFQVELVKGYLGDLAKIKTIDLEVIENALEIGGEN